VTFRHLKRRRKRAIWFWGMRLTKNMKGGTPDRRIPQVTITRPLFNGYSGKEAVGIRMGGWWPIVSRKDHLKEKKKIKRGNRDSPNLTEDLEDERAIKISESNYQI